MNYRRNSRVDYHGFFTGALDRLHLVIAPLLLGSGIPAFTLPEAATPADGLRFHWRVHHLGDDLLLDIPLQRQSPSVCPRAETG